MTHTGSPKRIIFDPDSGEILDISTRNLIAKGPPNHAFKEYEFYHFLPHSYPSSLLTHANDTSMIWNEIFVHLNFKYFWQLHNEEMVEGFPLIKSSQGVCNGFLVGKHPKWRYEVGKERRDASTLDLVHINVFGPIPTSSMNGSRDFSTFIDDY